MITLYKPTETDFTHNGIGILDDNIYDAVIEEELNGLYVLSFKYPLFAPHGLEIGGQCLIKAPTPDGNQLFRVARPAPSMGELNVFCYHVFYDLVDNLIEDTFIQEKGGQAALQQMKERMQYSTNFNFISDISTIASSRLVGKNPVEAILDNSQDNSFLSRWGGELKRDNFTVHMLRERGRDRGVVIQHKKDLLGYESDVDWTNVITRMMPKGFDGLLLPEKYVESYNASKYIKPKIRVVEFDHIKAAVGDYADDEDAVPLPQAYQMLRDAAKKMYDEQHVDFPKATYKVEFQELSQTEEYKDLAVLQRVYMGDTVTVIHEEDGFEIEAKVNHYKYDPINEEYIELTLGNFKESFVDITGRVDNVENNFNDIRDSVNGIKNNVKGMEKSILEQARENATNLINSGFGGHVRIYPERILIMDTADERTAKKVWQWNINGFGYSSTGINGPYNTAITMDGRIVADFITTGTLNGNLVRGGEIVGSTIRTDNGSTYVNLQKQFIRLMESNKNRLFIGYYNRSSDNQIQPTILMHDDIDTNTFKDGTLAMSQFPNTAKTVWNGSVGIVKGKETDGTAHYASRINFDTSGDFVVNNDRNAIMNSKQGFTVNSDGQFTTDTFRTRIESTDNIDVISGGKLWMGSDLSTNIVAGQNTVITSGVGISQYANGGSYWVESQNGTTFTVKNPTSSFWVDAPKAVFKCGLTANGINVYDNWVDSTGSIRYMNGAKGWGFYGHIGSPGWAYFTLS
ncbi:phage tail spike protein [Bacillus thuringiensis]|uniref:Phage endopeptidase n=1 Tax=Bacillus thuringiensis Bt18247 TaxID=1423143 RepID=A0A9W3X6R5_BACTU|nr:phage tail spike protein [Bacillus thuringiensis]AOM08945.1 phage endopeptidase [Bacillus thuringiensis Bt18247]